MILELLSYYVPKFLLLAMPIAGAFLYRWRGMSHPYKYRFPRPYNQIVFALPYATVAGLHWLTIEATLNLYALPVFILVWALTTLAIVTGHGNWIDLGSMPDSDEDETTEFAIKFLKDKMPRYWYDVLGLSFSGLLISLPAGIATANPFLAVSGLAKGLAYMIAQFTDDKDHGGGERLTGAFLWGAITC